ncbi:MAG: 50S ribosomal protein L6 [Candidatus Diapherotrites archaeon CG10_big_fil_rev_8_21_14_0_10_31_34]|nr:MAG: 50S ribosomal protein L6 [Candidatus Diapherotrites archaeon CG10_big_fil_rev_8_21_14_0_10_31_34]PJA16664.1 MAG: 50S ribosomal protein L6 [Candidatus Diapherotrites archaeon CG_4_10_14_0_2_um_filter_31_5]
MKAQPKTIEIPEGTKAEVTGANVKITGKLGVIERDLTHTKVKIELKENKITVSSHAGSKRAKVTINTVEAHIKNMVEGTNKGYTYKMRVVFSHFPINVTVKGNTVEINNFVGEKKPRKSKIIGQTKVEIKGKEITLTGINKEEIGQTAANLEKATKIKNRDPRVFQDGIYLTEKKVNE